MLTKKLPYWNKALDHLKQKGVEVLVAARNLGFPLEVKLEQN